MSDIKSPHYKRVLQDHKKLKDKGFPVELIDDDIRTFNVWMPGALQTPYAGGVFKLRVYLPMQYPYKSPAVGFVTTLFHVNVDESSGSICLNVLNTQWKATYDLVNVFETFIPQLMRYPNPDDPLSARAASVFRRSPQEYEKTAREYTLKYAFGQKAPKIPKECEEDWDRLVKDLSSETKGNSLKSAKAQTMDAVLNSPVISDVKVEDPRDQDGDDVIF